MDGERGGMSNWSSLAYTESFISDIVIANQGHAYQ